MCINISQRQMATPNIPQDLADDVRRWADLTITICRRYDTPPIEEERFIYCMLLSTHPDRYRWCTRIHHLVERLRTELLNAQSRPRPASRNPTSNILPPNQPRPPSQFSTDPTAEGSSSARYRSNSTTNSVHPRATITQLSSSQTQSATAGLHRSLQT